MADRQGGELDRKGGGHTKVRSACGHHARVVNGMFALAKAQRSTEEMAGWFRPVYEETQLASLYYASHLEE